MDGAPPAAGTATLHLNGSEVDSVDGVGRLYSHSGNIGIGTNTHGTLIYGAEFFGSGTFEGSVDKLAHYNVALDGAELDQLQQALLTETDLLF